MWLFSGKALLTYFTEQSGLELVHFLTGYL